MDLTEPGHSRAAGSPHGCLTGKKNITLQWLHIKVACMLHVYISVSDNASSLHPWRYWYVNISIINSSSLLIINLSTSPSFHLANDFPPPPAPQPPPSHLILTSHRAAAGDLPEDQAHGVDVSSLERLKVFHVYGVVQDLWRHIPEQKDTNCYHTIFWFLTNFSTIAIIVT